MWHWLPSNHFNLNKRQRFLLSLCCVVLLGHLLLAILCMVISSGFNKPERFVVSSKKMASTLVLCPLKKRVSKQKPVLNKDNKISSSKVIDYQTYQQQKAEQKTVTVQQVETKPVAQVSKTKNESLKKKSVAQAAKKPTLKVADISTKSAELKQEEKVEAKEVEAKKVEPVKSQESKEQKIDVDDVEFIGYEQLDTLAVQHKIQQHVQEYFTPPVGMQEGTCSELTVSITGQGKVSKAVLVKSSGSLVYDNAARTAIYKTVFPKEVWNKTITIVLGQ